MHLIGKNFKFDAAHQLEHLPTEHKCSRLHGHTYNVTLTLMTRGRLQDEGWVYDYGRLAAFKGYIDGELDHKFLNNVLTFPTTAERIAQYLFGVAEQLLNNLPPGAQVYSVRVQETADTFAEYRREG